jgi:hypothetical protein
MGNKEDDQQYSEAETVRRRDEWLPRSLPTPPKDVVAERKAKRGNERKIG